MFVFTQQCCTLEFDSFSVRPTTKSTTIASILVCPVTVLSNFLSILSEGELLQKAFVKFPLKKRQFNSEFNYEYKINTDFKISNELNRNGYWVLTSIGDLSLRTNREIPYNWLDIIFPSIVDCTPKSFYYDKNEKRTDNGILERLGYFPYRIDAVTARYKIHEKFYGLDAIEIAIPSGTDSVYVITVLNGAKDFSETIMKKIGQRPQIYNENFKVRSSVAYLISDDKKISSFVCYTFQE